MELLSEHAGPAGPGARQKVGALLSVVVPFYNEGAGVEPFFARLIPVLDRLSLSWEVICVNDGSLDDTLARLIARHEREPRIRIIDFSRNFGKEPALSAGLAHARGEAVLPLDADLQHPPEVIPELIAKWREGYEVVYAVRSTRAYQSALARMMSRLFYWIFERLSDVPLPEGAGDFRLLDRRVVDVINRMPERTRFMKGIFAWVGFRQVGVRFTPAPRREGESKWAFLRLLGFAFDGLTAFSNFPLKVWGLIGASISLLAFVYIVVRLLRTAIYGIERPRLRVDHRHDSFPGRHAVVNPRHHRRLPRPRLRRGQRPAALYRARLLRIRAGNARASARGRCCRAGRGIVLRAALRPAASLGLGLAAAALAYGGGWELRQLYVEPGAAALACNIAVYPAWCLIRFALLFGQLHLLFGLAALAAGSVALLRGGRGLALAAGALALFAIANYNVETGALALVLALIAAAGAVRQRSSGQDAG